MDENGSPTDLAGWIDFTSSQGAAWYSILTGRTLPAGTSSQQASLLIAQQQASQRSLLLFLVVGAVAYVALRD